MWEWSRSCALGDRVGLLLLWIDAASACPTPVSLAELDAAAASVLGAFEDRNPDLLLRAVALEQAIPCLADPLTPMVAATVHRAEGLAAFARQDHLNARLQFAAAHALDGGRLPDWFAPPGNALWEDLDAIRLDDVERLDVPAPATGEIRIDGRAAPQRLALPVIVQILDANGLVTLTLALALGDPLPDYPHRPPPPPPVVRFTATDPHRLRRFGSVATGVVGLGAIGAGAGLLAYGEHLRVFYSAYDTANAYYTAGGISLAVGGVAVLGSTLGVVLIDGRPGLVLVGGL